MILICERDIYTLICYPLSSIVITIHGIEIGRLRGDRGGEVVDRTNR